MTDNEKKTYLIKQGEFSMGDNLGIESKLTLELASHEIIRDFKFHKDKEIGIINVFSSPNSNAIKTAKIIEDSLSLQYKIYSSVQEDLLNYSDLLIFLNKRNYEVGLFVTNKEVITNLLGKFVKCEPYRRF